MQMRRINREKGYCCAHDLDGQVLEVRNHISRIPNKIVGKTLINCLLKQQQQLKT